MTNDSARGTLLLPVANPETADRLMDTAIDIARGRSMRLVIIHVVEVPAQLPLSGGDRLVEEAGEERQLLEHATQLAKEAGVDAEDRIRYARDVAKGIVGAVDTHDADALLMGWRGRPRRRDIVLGSFLDKVLGNAPCDVYVRRIRTPTAPIGSILVAVGGGPHDELATELAGTIAAQRDATVHLLHVHETGASGLDREEATTVLEDRRANLDEEVDVTTEVVEAEHVAGAITDATAHHDLALLGATQDPILKRRLVGSVAQGVGRASACPVIVTRRYVRADGE